MQNYKNISAIILCEETNQRGHTLQIALSQELATNT
jgi:hypothetical protein